MTFPQVRKSALAETVTGLAETVTGLAPLFERARRPENVDRGRFFRKKFWCVFITFIRVLRLVYRSIQQKTTPKDLKLGGGRLSKHSSNVRSAENGSSKKFVSGCQRSAGYGA